MVGLFSTWRLVSFGGLCDVLIDEIGKLEHPINEEVAVAWVMLNGVSDVHVVLAVVALFTDANHPSSRNHKLLESNEQLSEERYSDIRYIAK